MMNPDKVAVLITKWRKEYPRKTAKMFNEMLDELEQALAEPQPKPHKLSKEEWKEIVESQYG